MAVTSPYILRDRPTALNANVGDGTVQALAGLTGETYGQGPFKTTALHFSAVALAITDALAYSGQKVWTFPAGIINVYGAIGSMTFTTTSAIAGTLNSGVLVSWGIGTVTASNIVLSTTMQNLIPGTGIAVVNFTSSTVINVAPAVSNSFLQSSTPGLSTIPRFDGTTTAVALFLNLGVPTITDIDADATLTVTGEVNFNWSLLGDY